MPSPRYQKGHKKLGGRRKGTLNKKTQRRLALEKLSSAELQQIMLAELKLSPLEVMQAVMLLRINKGDYDGALVAAEKAAPYQCMHAVVAALEPANVEGLRSVPRQLGGMLRPGKSRGCSYAQEALSRQKSAC